MMNEKTIQSIEGLVRELEYGTGVTGYLGLLHHLQIDPDSVVPYLKWAEDHYTRKLLFSNDEVEMILMCWKPGQTSPIHSYDDQEGWIYVIEGVLTIDHYFRSSVNHSMEHYQTLKLGPGKFLYLNDYIGFHRVRNDGPENVVSLHIHAGPVTQWNVYDPETKKFYEHRPSVEK
ncbi:MAG: cysteine dioxygenase family protein [Bacteroidota bacterium]|nr:cysteine dioxygenase family protein [Bacteroidota bacterium]MDX5427126.1 cysteine dioxygenase family protein [Bacteroidota bacterium]MDX5448398.1 cysteine dioxygenase family protein [Bacteroidota bacterium]MDX5505093.1 cysteine dioxygenase family protein [Bacteroidota bacterium]